MDIVGFMKSFAAMTVLTAALGLGFSSTATAFEGGGRKPSTAPLITVGQHYTGQLNNHENDANFGSNREVALWKLPPLTTRDVVIVDWHAAPYTNDPGYFPICLLMAQRIDDFNWGSVFADALGNYTCNNLSGSGSAKTELVAQETDSSSTYLEFTSRASGSNPSEYETYPYDFTVEPIQHYLDVAARPIKRVSANGVFRATANLATGLPMPDGLNFNLTVTWSDDGVASYSGVSSGGVVSFQLALPETAYGENARFAVSHPADGTYQEATAPTTTVKVARPRAPEATPCEKARRQAHALARQHRRLSRRARHARGAARARLHRRARQTGRRLRAARRRAASACATP